MQNPHFTSLKTGRMFARENIPATGLHSCQADVRFLEKIEKESDGIAATPNTSHHFIRKTTFQFKNLAPGFLPDYLVEVSYHHRERVSTKCGSQYVMRFPGTGHPVPHGLVDSVLQGALTTGYRPDLSSAQAHPENIQGLATHVLLAHVDDAFQTKFGAHGSRGDSVLSGTGFSNDSGLSKTLGQKHLTQHIVDLVSPRVQEILTLQVDPGPAQFTGHVLGKIQTGGPPGINRQIV